MLPRLLLELMGGRNVTKKSSQRKVHASGARGEEVAAVKLEEGVEGGGDAEVEGEDSPDLEQFENCEAKDENPSESGGGGGGDGEGEGAAAQGPGGLDGSRRVTMKDIQVVQNLIERCLQLCMSQKEVVKELHDQVN